MTAIFVTATDTDAGKTLVSAAIMHLLAQQKRSVVGYKPIAAGAEFTDGQLKNDDALTLQQYCTERVAYEHVNPICFEQAIAPHIAATLNNTTINPTDIVSGFNHLVGLKTDHVIVEGAGGWMLPISHQSCLPEAISELPLQVVLVVGMKLGCLSHALLTEQAVKVSGFDIVGWVANHVDADMQFADENVETLTHMLRAPCLGRVPFLDDDKPEIAAQYLNIAPLL